MDSETETSSQKTPKKGGVKDAKSKIATDSKMDKMTYTEAMDELQEILEALREDEVDVDELTTKVQRGYELIKFCQGKISTAEAQVNEIMHNIELDSKEE